MTTSADERTNPAAAELGAAVAEQGPLGNTHRDRSQTGFTRLEAANHNACNDPGVGFGVQAPELRDQLGELGLSIVGCHINPLHLDICPAPWTDAHLRATFRAPTRPQMRSTADDGGVKLPRIASDGVDLTRAKLVRTAIVDCG